ncbi:MAG TPA: hypothetical protein VFB27_03435 [Opitutaceae bacterium]|nr:hypothetical protein [Opitutaceae bacterium]
MKLNHKTLFVLAALSAAGFAYAQEAATDAVPTGTLGLRYGDVNVGLQDIRHLSQDAFNVGVGANIPVTNTLDASFAAGRAWLNSTVDQAVNAISVTGTEYTSFRGVKPFAFAGIGYAWEKDSFGSLKNHSEYGIWGLGVGVEVPATLVFPAATGLSVAPAISYSDDFRKSRYSAQSYEYGAEINYWMDAKTAVYADIGYQDVLRSRFDSWDYTLGVRIRY